MLRGLFGFAVISGIYLFSLFVFYFFSLSFPPALVGIFILLLSLILFGRLPSSIALSGSVLLRYMGLFLLPALISVLLYGELLSQYYAAMIAVVLLSTIVSMTIALSISQRFLSGVKRSAIAKAQSVSKPSVRQPDKES